MNTNTNSLDQRSNALDTELERSKAILQRVDKVVAESDALITDVSKFTQTLVSKTFNQ